MASVKSDCVGYGRCVDGCPTGAISIIEKRAVIDGSKCIGCGKCATLCKLESIDIYLVNEQKKHLILWYNE